MSSTVKTAALLGGLSLLLMFVGSFFGQGGLIIAFVLALGTNAFSYWFSDKVVLKMYNATQVGPEHPLYRITARLAQKAQLPMPKVYVIPQDSPNAFATGRDPHHAAVAATEGILRMLPENELEGVIAHELAHVKNRDILISTVAATVAATIMFVANMARWSMFLGGGQRDDDRNGPNIIALLAMTILAPIAAMLIQFAISRQREFAADRGGADIIGSPSGLANALRHIDAAAKQLPMDANPATAHMFIIKPFSAGGLKNLFSSHPPTEERISALMAHRA